MKYDKNYELSRREFIRKAALLGLSVGGSKTLMEVVFGDDILAASTDENPATVRWAMVVDMTKCSRREDCSDCMAVCHRTHNVPAISNRRHEIKWIWREPFVNAFPELKEGRLRKDLYGAGFIVLCNHCDNPPCVRVCPTRATWRRQDGIVMMDMHRCIGCRYCMAACPYGSRSFNWMDPRKILDEKAINQDYPTRTKGVVEKCDFCAERIDRGMLPVCVEACKEKALVFGNLSDAGSPVSGLLAGRFAIRRKPELGTRPEVYYIV
jgi:molybdopterin-containing oxidoreductase family iron-sulfur binding subunit